MIRHGLEQLKANGKRSIDGTCTVHFCLLYGICSCNPLHGGRCDGSVHAPPGRGTLLQACQKLCGGTGKRADQISEQRRYGSSRELLCIANQFLDGERYLEYNSDYPDTSKYQYVLDTTDLSDITKSGSLPENFGNLRITLSKEKNSSENQTELEGGEIPVQTGSYDAVIAEKQNISVRQYILR